MTSFANLPPPKTSIRRIGVLNGASWGVLVISTVWNTIWFFMGTALHFNKWLASIPNFPIIVLVVSTIMVLLGVIAVAIALDVLFRKKSRWIAFGILWLWLTPVCIGVSAIYLGWPNRSLVYLDIAAGWILALIVRLNSPLLRSRELKSMRSVASFRAPTPPEK